MYSATEKHDKRSRQHLYAQGRAYVKVSPGLCRCFILKLSCHSINISIGLGELKNSLHRGAVASFQLGLWDDVIFLGCTVVCRRLVAILDPPLCMLTLICSL
jgi:hypothetical protein